MITDKGRETLREAAETHAAACEELIGAHLAEGELDDLAGLLDRLPGVGTVDAGRLRGPSVDSAERRLSPGGEPRGELSPRP